MSAAVGDDARTRAREGDCDPGTPVETGAERRSHERFETWLQVDVTSAETFLFAYITNISEMGIFVRSEAPLAVGTELSLRFAPSDGPAFELPGMVVWINPMRANGDNPNPGMGVRFSELSADQRERVVDLVRTVAYLSDDGGD
jgi:type IV pilus assembly protein PilZ